MLAKNQNILHITAEEQSLENHAGLSTALFYLILIP